MANKEPEETPEGEKKTPADHLAEHQFRPGNPGGPGRPPDTPEQKEVKKLTKIFENINKDYALKLIQSGRYETLLDTAIREAAANGKLDWAKFLNDYVDGPPDQKIEHSGQMEFITTNVFDPIHLDPTSGN